MNTRYKYPIYTLLLIVGVILWGLTSVPDGKLHVIFCDVGQGDAILIIKGSTQILIDGGPNDKVLGCLSKHVPFYDRDLEMVIVTHPEADHLTGIVSVIDRYKVKQIVSNSLVADTGVFGRFREEVIRLKIPVYSPKYGDKIKIANLQFSILMPEEKQGNEIVWKNAEDPKVLGISSFTGNFNTTMIVSELKYGSFRAMLTGDAGFDQEKIIEADGVGRVDVLKVGHHGSKYSTSTEFLDLIRPSLAVISVGASNNYGHPTVEVLERLKELGIKIKRTDLDGEVEVVSNGKGWGVIN